MAVSGEMLRAGGSRSDGGESGSLLPAFPRRIPPKRFELSSVKLFQVSRTRRRMVPSKISKMERDESNDDAAVPQCRVLSRNFSATHFADKDRFQEDTSFLNRCQSIPFLPKHSNLANDEAASCLDGGDTVPPRGLCNIGNTCYQNAIVQTLYFNSDLRRYMDLPHSHMSENAQCLDGGGKVTKTLSELISNMASGGSTFTSQHKFKSMVDSHMEQFNGKRQHDAQEFLLSLLNQLQEEAGLHPASETRHSPHSKVQSCVSQSLP